MEKVISKITGKTMIPISLVIAIIGGGSFATTATLKSDRNSDLLKSLEKKIDRHISKKDIRDDKILTMLIEIEKKLARIEGTITK